MAKIPLNVRRLVSRGFNRHDARYRTRFNFLATPGTKASLTTALAGANNDLVYTAVFPGAAANGITITYVNAGASKPLAVSAVGSPQPAISVQLATDGSSVITSTAAQVRDAINTGTHTGRSRVQVANAPGNDGTGLVTAMATTPLAGGTG